MGNGWQTAYGAGGAADALKDFLAEKFAREKFAEVQRQAKAQEAADVAQRAQQADQFRLNQAQRQAEFVGERDDRYQGRIADVRRADQAIVDRREDRELRQKESQDERAARAEERRIDREEAVKNREDQQAFMNEQRRASEANARDIANLRLTNTGGMDAREKLNATIGLGKTYNFNTKAQREVQRYHGIMTSAMDSLKKGGDHNIAEQSIVQAFNKILDPGSVVREGEYDRTAGGIALINQMGVLKQKIGVGGKIPPATLQAMTDLSQQYANQAAEFNGRERRRIERLGSAFGLDTSLVFQEEDAAPPGPGPGGGGAPAAKGRDLGAGF